VQRYFFHIYDDLGAIDEEGRELADLDAAKREALRGVRSLIADELLRTGRISLEHRIEVAGESGQVLFALHFRDAVTIAP
jgi:hypothetical protein